MKTLLVFLLSFMALSFVVHTPTWAHTTEVGIGDVAPDIVLPNPNGLNASLSTLSGNIVLVYFWVSWDPGSRKNNAELENLYTKYHTSLFPGAKGFEIFTVSLDYENQEWINALRSDRLPGAYHTNDFYSKYAGVYGIDKLPAMFIVDENGVVQSKDADLNKVDQWLKERSSDAGTAQTVVTIPSQPIQADQEDDGLYPNDKKGEAKPIVPTNNTKPTDPAKNVDDISNGATVTGKNYRVQIGAYKSMASVPVEALKQLGQVNTETAGEFKRVLVGSSAKLSEAISLQKKLQKTGYPGAIIVQYDNNNRVKVMTKAELEKAESALPPVPVKNPMGGNTNTKTAQTNARKATNNNTAKVEWQKMPDPTTAQTTAKTKPKVAAVEEPVADNLSSVKIDAKNIAVLKQKSAGQKVVTNVPATKYQTAKADEALMADSTPPANANQAGFTWSEPAKSTAKGFSPKPVFTPPTQTAKSAQVATAEQTVSDPNFSESYTKSSSGVSFTPPNAGGALSSDRPTYYDYNDPYISASYTKPNDTYISSSSTTTYKSGAATTTVTQTTTTTPITAAPIERQKATPTNATATAATKPTVSTTTPAPTATAPIVPTSERQKATPINEVTPTAAAVPNTNTPAATAKTEATNKIDNLDQYLDNYDYSSASSSKSKILKNKEKRNKKKEKRKK